MLDNGYFITAELRVKNEERLQEAKVELRRLCKETVKESGCSLFSLHQCAEDKRRFLLWERFDNEDAYKQHFSEKHTQDYIALDLTQVVQYFQTDIVAIEA